MPPKPANRKVPASVDMLRNTQPMPSDHLFFALFITIFCCLPLGIIALIKSIEVKEKYKEGDFDASIEASKSTKRWSMAGLIIGIIMFIAMIITLVFFIIDHHKNNKAVPNADVGDDGYMQEHSVSSTWD